MTRRDLSLERAWRELEAAYDMALIEQLVAIPTADVYLFGGAVRDMLLDKPWKDADLCVVDRRHKDERNTDVERICNEHGTVLRQLYFSDGECSVLRVRVPGNKQILTDLNVVDSLQVIRCDFTISSIFIHLGTGELYSQSPQAFDDLDSHLIRATSGDRVLQQQSPYIFFRALKLACSTGFDFEVQLEQMMRENTDVVRKHFEDDLAYIKEHGKDSFTEFRLANDFGGFSADPRRLVSLINDFDFYRPVCRAFATIAPSLKASFGPAVLDPSKYGKGLKLEQYISQFLSDIARSISTGPGECFEIMKHAMALDSDRADGNEFVVKPREIEYRSS